VKLNQQNFPVFADTSTSAFSAKSQIKGYPEAEYTGKRITHQMKTGYFCIDSELWTKI
jgi:hypothetical protein